MCKLPLNTDEEKILLVHQEYTHKQKNGDTKWQWVENWNCQTSVCFLIFIKKKHKKCFRPNISNNKMGCYESCYKSQMHKPNEYDFF